MRKIAVILVILAVLAWPVVGNDASAQSWSTHFLAVWDGMTFTNGPGSWTESGMFPVSWGMDDSWGYVAGAPAGYNGVPGSTYLATLWGDQVITSDAAMPETNPGWALPPGADWQRDADYAVELAYAVDCWDCTAGGGTVLTSGDGRIELRYDENQGGHILLLDGAPSVLAGPDSAATWHVVRIERLGAQWQVYFDGTSVFSQPAAQPDPFDRIPAALALGDSAWPPYTLWVHSLRVEVSLAGGTPPPATPTPTPTITPTPTGTATPTPTPGPAATATPAVTNTPGPSPSWAELMQGAGDCAVLGCLAGGVAPAPPQVYGQRPWDTSAMVYVQALFGIEGLGRVDFLVNTADDGTAGGQWVRFAAPRLIQDVQQCDAWGFCWWETMDNGPVQPPPYGATDAVYVNPVTYSNGGMNLDYRLAADGSFTWQSSPAAGDIITIAAKLGDCEAESATPQFSAGFCRGRHLVRVDVYDLNGHLRQQDFGVHEWTPPVQAEYQVEFVVRAVDGSTPPDIMCRTQIPVWYGWPENDTFSTRRNYSADFLGTPAAWQVDNHEDNGNPVDPTVYSAVGFYNRDFAGFSGQFSRTFTVKQGQYLELYLQSDDNTIWETVDEYGPPVVSPALPGISVVGDTLYVDSAVTPPGSSITVTWTFTAWGDRGPGTGTANPPWSNPLCEPDMWLRPVPPLEPSVYSRVVTAEVSLPSGFYDPAGPDSRLELWLNDNPGGTDAGSWLKVAEGQGVDLNLVYKDWPFLPFTAPKMNGPAYRWTAVRGLSFDCAGWPGLCRGRHLVRVDVYQAGVLRWQVYPDRVEPVNPAGAVEPPEVLSPPWQEWWEQYDITAGAVCSDGSLANVPGLQTLVLAGGPFNDQVLYESYYNQGWAGPNLSPLTTYTPRWLADFYDPGQMGIWAGGVPVRYGNHITLAGYDSATGQWLNPFAVPPGWISATLTINDPLYPPEWQGDHPGVRLETAGVVHNNDSLPAYQVQWLAPASYCTPAFTPTPTPTFTSTPTPTFTSTPTPTFTPTPTATPVPGLVEPTPESSAPPVYLRLEEREGVAQPPFYLPLQTSLKVAPVFAGAPLEVCFDTVCYPADWTVPVSYTYLGMEAQGIGFVPAELTVNYTPGAPNLFTPGQMLRLYWDMPGVGEQTASYGIDGEGYHFFRYPGVRPGIVRLYLRLVTRFEWDGTTTAGWPGVPPDAPAGWQAGDPYTQTRVFDLVPPGRHVYLYLTRPVIENED